MSKKFNTYIDGITPDFWRDLCVNEGQLRHYDRGDEFVTHGEVARFLGYIKSGTFKYIASSSTGEEHVIGLEFTGEFIADFPFSLTGQPSRVSIVAESPADVYCIPVKSVADRLQDDKRLRQIVARSTEAIFATVYDRYIELCTRSPQDRYDDLITRHPDLFSLFSLRDIASFLNITPTHLSRLRRITVGKSRR